MINSSFLAPLLTGSRVRLVVGAILGVAISISLLSLLFNAGRQADTAVAQRSDTLDLNTLAPELEEAEAISLDDLNQSQRQKIAGVDGISFRFEGDFNHDGQQDLMLLGRYRTDDMPSSFLLVATREPAGWTRAQLLTFEHDFVIGRMFESGLAVFFCVGCDYGGYIRWTGSQYAFEPFASPGVP